MYDRNELLDELHAEQENLAGYLASEVVEYDPTMAPVWSQNEEGNWGRSGYYSTPNPEAWDMYYDGVAAEY